MPKQTNYWAKTATDEANLSSVLQSHDCPVEGVYKIDQRFERIERVSDKVD